MSLTDFKLSSLRDKHKDEEAVRIQKAEERLVDEELKVGKKIKKIKNEENE